MKAVKTVLLVLVLAILPLVRTVSARAQSTDELRIAKIKSQITKRIANKKERVKLKLTDGSEVKGKLKAANDSNFTLIEDKTNNSLELAYDRVNKVSGRGMSTLTKVGIGAAIGVGVIAILVAVALNNFDPFTGAVVPR
jgi:small nuclear ribonucleoprotein (snRNP)-like protein